MGDNFYNIIDQERDDIKYLLCKHRWFSGRMLACHAGDPGLIPGRCILEKETFQMSGGTKIRIRKHNYAIKHWWFNGRMLASHASDPGSIPGQCKLLIIYDMVVLND